MSKPKLSKLELQILEALWARENASIREIQEAFPEPRPAYTTIQTTVYRLERKKALRRVRKLSNAHIFEPTISRDLTRHRLLDEILSFFGAKPKVYAEAILNVCKHYLESPIACVSGITGSDVKKNLKKRIDAIMASRIRDNLNLTKKLLLAVGAIAVVAAPIAIGLVNSPTGHAQSTGTRPQFEVASIKPSNSADQRPLFMVRPGGRLTVTNFTVKMLIRAAYHVKVFQISGGPSWMDSDLFDIDAKPEGDANMANPGVSGMSPKLYAMFQSLLAERFRLVIWRETKEMPVYALAVAKNGPKFKEANETDPNIIDVGGLGNAAGAPKRLPVTRVRRGLVVAQEATMTGFADNLSDFLGRAVVDKTGLTGNYDLKLEWQPDENQVAMFQAMRVPEGYGAPPVDPLGPSLFDALQEQLGLKLQSEKGPVETFVIERVEKPSAN